jgi:hypothetical protein
VQKWHGEKGTSWKIQALGKCGQRKEFAATRIRMIRCAKVAQLKGHSNEGMLVEQG